MVGISGPKSRTASGTTAKTKQIHGLLIVINDKLSSGHGEDSLGTLGITDTLHTYPQYRFSLHLYKSWPCIRQVPNSNPCCCFWLPILGGFCGIGVERNVQQSLRRTNCHHRRLRLVGAPIPVSQWWLGRHRTQSAVPHRWLCRAH